MAAAAGDGRRGGNHRRFRRGQRARTGDGHVTAQDIEQGRQIAARQRSSEGQPDEGATLAAQNLGAIEQPPGPDQRQQAARQP